MVGLLLQTEDWTIVEGCHWRGHRLTVPLNWREPASKNIEIYAREVRVGDGEEKPYLLYLQGGPGFEAPRVTTISGWMKVALERFNLILLDQRGTGLSTPIDASIMKARSDHEVADYLACFRAPSIVRDAEALRKHLLGNGSRWSIFGQSFGGFCCLTYLSLANTSLERVLITGGIGPIGSTPKQVYEALYQTVIKRNERFYHAYPQAVQLVRTLVDEIECGGYVLPNGDSLTVRRLQSLGIMLGRDIGAASLYTLLEEGVVRDDSGRLTQKFLYSIQDATSFHTNPMYALMHESIYCEGTASAWAAQEVRENLEVYTRQVRGWVPFDGEMVFPWMFEQMIALKPFAGVMRSLMEKDDWGALYEMDVLRTNTVPTACLVYDEDMYVDRGLSIEVAEEIGHCRVWSTNEYEHNGIARDGKRIFNRLMAMTDGDSLTGL